jgi:hypothetical protein
MGVIIGAKSYIRYGEVYARGVDVNVRSSVEW